MDPNSISVIAESTDWGFVSIIVQITASLITCIALLLASVVAIYGITAWKREFRGKRQMELAEDVLTLFYEAKDAIYAIRSGLIFEGEGNTRKPVDGESEQEKKLRDRAYIVWERYDKYQSVFNKLHSMRYRFMTQIGKKEAEPFDQIRNIVLEISCDAGMLGDLWVERTSGRSQEEKRELNRDIEKCEATIWWQGSKDEIDKQVAKIISQMEKTCESIIMKAR